MKINYVCQFDPTRHRGGGEMILADVIAAGRERGHRFTFTSVRPGARHEFAEDADLDLLAEARVSPGLLGAWVQVGPRLEVERIPDLVDLVLAGAAPRP